jgi:hypothetical protein
VWRVVALRSQLNMYFSHAVYLALFGYQLGCGLAFIRWILKTWLIILSSLLSQLAVLERDAHSFKLAD